MKNIVLRKASKQDSKIILELIKELAEYEKLLHEVKATEEIIEKNIFDNKYAEVLIAEYEGVVSGFALYFYNFSTFLGKPGIYLEDLFIKNEYRGKGIGKKLFSELSKIAIEKDCGRIQWQCLDWNKPSIDFYKKQGAESLDEWITFRVEGKKQIERLGEL